jgi:hypothetical protein
MASYISNANRTHLNRMNRAAQNVNLGTIIQDLVAGSAVASASLVAYQSSVIGLSASAVALQTLIAASGSKLCAGSEVNIPTGLAAAPRGYIIQCNRSGSCATIPLYVTTGSGTAVLKVTAASGVNALTTTDTITFFAYS